MFIALQVDGDLKMKEISITPLLWIDHFLICSWLPTSAEDLGVWRALGVLWVLRVFLGSLLLPGPVTHKQPLTSGMGKW